MIAASVLLIIGLIGFATTSWLYVRSSRAQAQAEQQAARADAVTDFLNNDVLRAADPFSGDTAQRSAIKQALVAAVENIDSRFAQNPMTEASIRITLGSIFNSMREGAAAEPHWRRANTLLAAANISSAPTQIQSHYGLAGALTLQSKFDQALSELKAADNIRSMYGINDSQTILNQNNAWGTYFVNRQQTSQALPYLEKTLELLKKQSHQDLHALDHIRISLSQSYVALNRLKDAEYLSSQLIKDLEQRAHPSQATLVWAKSIYSDSLQYQHRYKEAQPVIEQAYQIATAALGDKNITTLDILNSRCSLYFITRQLEKALQCMQRAYDLTREVRGEKSWIALARLGNLGSVQYDLQRYIEADNSFESSYNGIVHIFGPNHSLAQSAAYNWARCLLHLHQSDHANLLMQQLSAEALQESEPGAPWQLRLQLLRGMVLVAQGHHSDALVLLQPAMQLHDDADPTDNILQEARQAVRKIEAASNDQHLASSLNKSS